MKPNRSIDGRMRATVRVQYRVGLDDLELATAAVLMEQCSHRQEAEELEEAARSVTKTEVKESLRDALQTSGVAWVYAVGDNAHERTLEMAAALAARLFPEFGD